MRVPEAQALVEAVMDGKVHRDYVVVGGSQCTPACSPDIAPGRSPQAARRARADRSPAHPTLPRAPALADVLTTVMESAYYGRNTSTAAGGGIVMVKTRRVLILATYAEPVSAAEAIPHVHRFADEPEGLTSPV